MSWYTDSGQPGEGFLREAKIASCTGIEMPTAKFFVIFGSATNTSMEITAKKQKPHDHSIMSHIKETKFTIIESTTFYFQNKL